MVTKCTEPFANAPIFQVMKIIDNIRPDRQTVMFSATFPRQMEALARRILNKPVEVQVGGRSVVCKDVEQHVVSVVQGIVLSQGSCDILLGFFFFFS